MSASPEPTSDTSLNRAPDPDAPAVMRYKMTLAYEGTDFHGWQKQRPVDGRPELRTVCGVVEQTLRRVVSQPVDLVGASRTDAGVHARGQVAHFDAATRIPIERLAAAINSRLPPDIDVIDVAEAPLHFDAIRHVGSKQYRYRLFNTQRRPLEKRNVVWHCWYGLDVDRMNDAATRLIGEHDFAGFAAAGHGRLSTVRSIFNCFVERHEPEVHVVVEGSGFLYNMVRIIAGTLVDVGRGHFAPDVIDRVLMTCERSQAGPTLPPQGLWLEWIRYEPRPGGTARSPEAEEASA